MKTIATRLTDGQDLFESIQKLATAYDIKAGIILSGIGSLRASKMRLPILNGEVKYASPKDVEIVSLQGTVSINGCHLHITVSDTKGKVIGGHLKQGCTIRTTCELVIGIIDEIVFKREPDLKTGFDELVIE